MNWSNDLKWLRSGPNGKYILSGIKSPFTWIKCHIPVIHKFCCGTKTAGKTQAATWGSNSKDWAFFRRTQSWKSCLTFSKLMKYSLGFCRNSWSGFGSAAKSTWFSSWIGWIGINLIVKFPLPLDLQYNTGSFKKLDLSYIYYTVHESQPLSLFIAFGAVTELIKPFSLVVKEKIIITIAGNSVLKLKKF